MITFKLYNTDMNDYEQYPLYSINLFNRINLVIGRSGSGKTYLADRLRDIRDNVLPWKAECYVNEDKDKQVKIRLLDNIEYMNEMLSELDQLIFIDEDTFQLIRQSGNISKIENSQNYFVIMDRQSLIKLDINIRAIFIFKRYRLNGEIAYKTEEAIKLYTSSITDVDIHNIKYIITEDTESGKQFWTSMLDKLEMIESAAQGSGEIRKTLEKLDKLDGDILVALDYDRGARIIQDIIRSKKINNNRIHFIPLESFEEVLCNSEFILDKCNHIRPLVLNYKKHITCRSKSTGKYFSALLFQYVKQKPPINVTSKRNAEQFYKKGMPNFKECFIDDCCSFNNAGCKLRFSGNKRKAMLANKFKGYRVFQSGGTDKG